MRGGGTHFKTRGGGGTVGSRRLEFDVVAVTVVKLHIGRMTRGGNRLGMAQALGL